ncbi:exocyst complex component EXO70H1-like isoform X2 [Andrographis paniculata]|uniref:exocyst complex component EXO70H1-like isoform X2 n=1 Tax=Andrographis paniculata TaxID=175694 RepID=UPI0021E857EE|nr:exocyst complex component EXO70H1-like isoform X2 [Andrographis paniculata]
MEHRKQCLRAPHLASLSESERGEGVYQNGGESAEGYAFHNRAHLDPESVSTRSSQMSTGSSTVDCDDDEEDAGRGEISEVEDASSLAMADLRLIAECMISSGYTRECSRIYSTIRKSIVDESLYRLGVEKLTSSEIHKMDWKLLELRINNWITAIRTAVKTLFNGERILCDHVFAISDSIRERCFAEISKAGAIILFEFPETVARNTKKSPEKLFRALDMYAAISNYLPEIESIFSFNSTLTVKSQVHKSFARLAEVILTALHDFESTILKESSKSPISGAGIHHLTINTMNSLSMLADYSNILSNILAAAPPPQLPKQSLPESFTAFLDGNTSPPAALSLKMAWLVLVLLCKLDTKSKLYKDVSLSYLFLANNLQYVVVKARASNLNRLLGDQWLTELEYKVKQFASNYERLGWSHVIESVPSDPTAVDSPEKVLEILIKFNGLFSQAYRKHSVCVVPDKNLRDDIKLSLARKTVPLYREFWNAHRRMIGRRRISLPMVRYTPDDVSNMLSELYFDSGGSLSFHIPSSPAVPSSFR